MSLQTAGYIAGIFLSLLGLWGWSARALAGTRADVAAFPRGGFVLLTIAFFWSFWPRPPWRWVNSPASETALFILPVGFLSGVAVCGRISARALGILFLLAAEPLLDAAFFRTEQTRLLVTVFAYLLIVIGLFWVTMPYLLRDQINWSARTNGRWRFTHGLVFLYGAAILACAVTRY